MQTKCTREHRQQFVLVVSIICQTIERKHTWIIPCFGFSCRSLEHQFRFFFFFYNVLSSVTHSSRSCMAEEKCTKKKQRNGTEHSRVHIIKRAKKREQKTIFSVCVVCVYRLEGIHSYVRAESKRAMARQRVEPTLPIFFCCCCCSPCARVCVLYISMHSLLKEAYEVKKKSLLPARNGLRIHVYNIRKCVLKWIKGMNECTHTLTNAL